MHIHITKGNANGKIWLEPVIAITYLNGFNTGEEREVLEIVTANFDLFKNKWNEYFGK